MNWYIKVLKNYAGFEGRARRKEYWLFFLFHVIILVALSLVDTMIGTMNVETGLGIVTAIYALAVLIPSIAVSVRRLHDTNRSAWWLLIGLVPIIGGLIFLLFMFFDGSPEDNQYGANPKTA